MIATSLLFRILGGLGTWVLYSQWLKLAVQPSVRIRAILSQTRDDGNITQLLALAAHLPTSQDTLEFYQTPVWESRRSLSEMAPVTNTTTTTTTTTIKTKNTTTILPRKIGTHMILMGNSNEVSLWASCKVPKESLETLVKSSTPNGKTVLTEPFWIRVWMQAIDDTVPASTPPTPGTYILRFRDYSDDDDNFVPSFERKYGSIRIFTSLRPNSHRPTKLILSESGHCTLTDHYIRWGVIPFKVEWRGHWVAPDVLVWTSHTKSRGIRRQLDLRMNQLRQDPWYIRVPKQTKASKRREMDPTVIVLERKGIGRLVFAKEK